MGTCCRELSLSPIFEIMTANGLCITRNVPLSNGRAVEAKHTHF